MYSTSGMTVQMLHNTIHIAGDNESSICYNDPNAFYEITLQSNNNNFVNLAGGTALSGRYINGTTFNTENLSNNDIVKYELISNGSSIFVSENSSITNITSEVGNFTPMLDKFLTEGDSLGLQSEMLTRYDSGLNYTLYAENNNTITNFTVNSSGYITNSTELLVGSYNLTLSGTDEYGNEILDDFKVFVYNSGNSSIIPVYPTLQEPTDGEINVSKNNINLSLTVFNNNGETMNVTFYLNNGTQIGFVSGLTNNTIVSILYNASEYDTTYGWYAVIDSDGVVEDVTSDVYFFTVEPTPNVPPVGSGLSPTESQEINIASIVELSVTVTDVDSVSIEVKYYLNDVLVHTKNVASDTISVNQVGVLDAGDYQWYATLDDGINITNTPTINFSVFNTAQTEDGAGGGNTDSGDSGSNDVIIINEPEDEPIVVDEGDDDEPPVSEYEEDDFIIDDDYLAGEDETLGDIFGEENTTTTEKIVQVVDKLTSGGSGDDGDSNPIVETIAKILRPNNIEILDIPIYAKQRNYVDTLIVRNKDNQPRKVQIQIDSFSGEANEWVTFLINNQEYRQIIQFLEISDKTAFSGEFSFIDYKISIPDGVDLQEKNYFITYTMKDVESQEEDKFTIHFSREGQNWLFKLWNYPLWSRTEQICKDTDEGSDCKFVKIPILRVSGLVGILTILALIGYVSRLFIKNK